MATSALSRGVLPAPVYPCFVFIFNDGPIVGVDKRADTQCSWPWYDAECKDVQPILSALLTSHFRFSNAATTAAWPLLAAHCNGEEPSPSVQSGSTQASSSISASARQPFSEALRSRVSQSLSPFRIFAAPGTVPVDGVSSKSRM